MTYHHQGKTNDLFFFSLFFNESSQEKKAALFAGWWPQQVLTSTSVVCEMFLRFWHAERLVPQSSACLHAQNSMQYKLLPWNRWGRLCVVSTGIQKHCFRVFTFIYLLHLYFCHFFFACKYFTSSISLKLRLTLEYLCTLQVLIKYCAVISLTADELQNVRWSS